MRKDLVSRRSLLQGLGLGSLFLSGLSKSVLAADVGAPAVRHAFFFHANGSHPFWTPTGTGSTFTLTEHLKPLEPLRNDIIIFRDMILQRGSGNSHKSTTFSALGAGAPTSFDQLLAKQFPGILPSLELAIGTTSGGGGVTPSLSQDTGVFLPGERNPVTAYQRVASVITKGATGDPAATAKALAANQSLLDYLKDDVNTFSNRLGGPEKQKAELYVQSLRDLETSLHKSLTQGPLISCGTAPPSPAASANMEAHVKDMPDLNHLFLDVMAVALACRITNVVSMMWGGGQSDESVPFVGMDGWHNVSHMDPMGSGGAKMIKMTAYLAGEWKYFLDKLKSYPEGNGNVLDNTMALWSTQNGHSCQTRYAKEDHDRHNTMFIIAGKCGGAFKTGKVVDCANRNHNDLYLAIAQAVGLKGPDGKPVTTIGMPEWCMGPLPGLT
jgi:Protein of unknown function (DUF1552)